MLAELGNHVDATASLREAKDALRDRVLQYYASLFLAAEYRVGNKLDLARSEYREAASLFPRAQAPSLGLSHLATVDGDRAAALSALQPALRSIKPEDDPWPVYMFSHLRNLPDLLRELQATVPA